MSGVTKNGWEVSRELVAIQPKRRLEKRLGEVLRGLVSLAVDQSVKNFAERRRRTAYEAAEKRYCESTRLTRREGLISDGWPIKTD